jgi:hypothetical protein
MVSAGNKSQRRSGDSIYRLPNDRAVTTTSRSILASRFSATEEVLMTHSLSILGHGPASLRRGTGIVEEHDVGFGMPSEEAEGLAVGRIVVILDHVRCEIGYLAAARTIKRLEP